MFCLKCGNQLPENAVFCPICGTKASDRSQQDTNQSNAEQNAPSVSAPASKASSKQGQKVWPYVLSGVAVIAIIFLGFKLIVKPNAESPLSTTEPMQDGLMEQELNIILLDDLCEAYSTNAVAADKQYANQRLNVQGEIASITPNPFDDTVSVSMSYANTESLEDFTIFMAYFEFSASNEGLYELEVGKTSILSGVLEPDGGGMFIHFSDATIYGQEVSISNNPETVDSANYPVQIDYIGEWWDSYSQRCYMTFEEFGDGSYSVEIHWSSSASMDTVWYLVARSTSKNNELTYENCVQKNIIYDENGNLSEDIVYVNGTGKFYYDGSYLHWQDDKENAGESCKFEKGEDSTETQNGIGGMENKIRFDTEFYSLEFPDYWEDLSVYDQWDIEPYSYGVTFYENQSLDDSDGDGGVLFSIALYSDEDYMDYPSYTYLGQLSVVRLATYDVVVIYPTDVQFSDAGQETYMKLSNDIDDILASFTPQPDVDCEYIPAN